MRFAARNFAITNRQGLHARPAQLFAQTATQYKAEITLMRDNMRVDAKSIMHILTLGAVQGTTLTVEAKGDDADEAIEALWELIQSDNFADSEILNREQAG
jgi:phosphocarrier protein